MASRSLFNAKGANNDLAKLIYILCSDIQNLTQRIRYFFSFFVNIQTPAKQFQQLFERPLIRKIVFLLSSDLI